MVGIGGPYGGGYALGYAISGLKIDIEFTVVGVTERYSAVGIGTAPLAGSFVVQHIFRCKTHGGNIFFFYDFDRGGSMDEGHGEENINSKKATVVRYRYRLLKRKIIKLVYVFDEETC